MNDTNDYNSICVIAEINVKCFVLFHWHPDLSIEGKSKEMNFKTHEKIMKVTGKGHGLKDM